MSAKPEKSKQTRREQYVSTDMGENHPGLALPNLSESKAEYLVSLLFECGPVSSNGMGPISLPWQEIEAWLRVTEKTLPLWEKQMIRHLSEAYAGEYARASELGRPDPYVRNPGEIDREAVSNSILSTLRSIQAVRDASNT